MIDGYGQNNIIKFKSKFENAEDNINSRNITSLNINSDVKVDLFDIDAYIPAVVGFRDYFVSFQDTKEAFKTFTFYVYDRLSTNNISILYLNYKLGEELVQGYVKKLRIAEIYDLSSEYLLLESALQYPKYYEIQKWLRPSDIKDLEFFKLYYLKELNGSFFLNKISGFNPDESKEPTKLELLRISDKTPELVSNFKIWTDGETDILTDGDDNLFF